MEVPKGKPVLRLVVGHHEEGDWTLMIKASGMMLLETDIGKDTSKDGWVELDVDLSRYAGSKTKCSLFNLANGWSDEAGYWASIAVVAN